METKKEDKPDEQQTSGKGFPTQGKQEEEGGGGKRGRGGGGDLTAARWGS